MANRHYSAPSGGKRGMALLLVVSVIAILSVVIIGFSRSMQVALVDASRYRDKVILESMSHSGTDIGIALLQRDMQLSDFDSLLENWARITDVSLDFDTAQGAVGISIVDLDGRFPVNSLVALAQEGKPPNQGSDGLTPERAREVLLRLLQSELFAVEDEVEAREIVDSLIDWIDLDDNESDYGAESSYYESLEKPLTIRNGPVDFIDELLQVKGITRDLLYGNNEKLALAEYISVENRSKQININTASAALIMALDQRITVEDLEGIDEFRTNEDNYALFSNSNWFIDYLPGDLGGTELTAMLTVESSHFSIETEAQYGEQFFKMRTIIERTSESEMKRLSFHVD